MAHATPHVNNALLTLHDASEKCCIPVESAGWWDWLNKEGVTTFHFKNQQGKFTARRERKSGGWYWYAYRRHHGKLHKAYLGKAEELTQARLDTVANELAAQSAKVADARHTSSPQASTIPAQPFTLAANSAISRAHNVLLTTKLFQPPVRPDLVPRPHLIERLDATFQRRLTLVTAPAGFGKTTLLSCWCQTLKDSIPHAWLSLDGSDNDLTRFWTYVAAALQEIVPDVGEQVMPLLQSVPPPIESILIVLLNMLATIKRDAILVLDDYHVITAQPIHDAMAFLLEHLPFHLHVVIASRSEPPLPLIRLRAQGQLNELQALDLRFTGDEVTRFLNQVMHLRLSPEEIVALDTHTEGWIASLQLAALSMQGRTDPGTMIATFTGSHRYIMDYLTEEVLHRQPSSIRDFLLQTSILERLSAPLCNAVTGRNDGQAALEYLEHANLFLIPLDEERRWYRYHHLFAEFLHNHLLQSHPQLVPELHRRASSWYEQQGWLAEAIQHALAGNDNERAISLLEQAAQAITMRGEVTMFLDLMAALPEEATRSRPYFQLFYSGALTGIGQLDASEYHLHLARQALDAMHQDAQADQAELQYLEGLYFGCASALVGFHGDATKAAELGEQALKLLPTNNAFVRSVIAASLGSAYLFSGNFVKASESFIEAVNLGHTFQHLHTMLASMTGQGYLEAIQGHLHRAVEIHKEAIRLGTRQGGQLSPSVSMSYTCLGELYYEWNDLDAAEHYAQQGIDLGKQWRYPGILANGYTTLAIVQMARGNMDAALTIMRQTVQTLKTYNMPQFTSLVIAMDAWMQLKAGNIAAATQWAHSYPLCQEETFHFPSELEHLFLLHILIAQGKLDEAHRITKRLLPALETTGQTRALITGLLIQAQILQGQGHTEQALTSLTRALTLAEPEGYIRTFIDRGGETLIPLLRQAAAHGVTPLYIHKLLVTFDTGKNRFVPQSPGLLSERELEVLRRIAAGKSNQAIAQELVVALSTIKTHINNIYAKLGVHSRTQAVARAKELHLLQ